MNQPLDGVRVVDFGQFIAAPAATQILVDLGADVIKVEPVTGEAARTIGLYGEAILRTYNRGKRAVAVDLATPRGQQLAHRLVADADIVVQNLRPGVMERFGLGAAAVRAAHPQVIYATVSGFGLHGPSKQRAGLDIAAQAESGIMWVTGEADGEPQRVGFPVVELPQPKCLRRRSSAPTSAGFASEPGTRWRSPCSRWQCTCRDPTGVNTC